MGNSLDHGNQPKPLIRILPLLACVFGITLLAGGCNSESVKDTSLASNDSGRVCREIEVTGSHFKKRICRSAATWEAIDRAEREGADDYTRQSSERSAVTTGTPAGGAAEAGVSMPTATGF